MLGQTKRAFTLIEVLTVVTILAIASAIIIPQMGSRDDLKAAAGARVIMADLIWAQNRAISTQQRQYVVFNGQSYTLKYWDSTTSSRLDSSNPITHNTYTTSFGTANTPLADVSISGTPTFDGKAGLCFDETGTPYGFDGTNEPATAMVSTGSIQVSCGAITLTISIEGYTGEASVK
jgi:prepilin-type N-terminal cleavage/methylation domain-containing protein